MIGIATTCLAETIGDDVAMFIREYRSARNQAALPPPGPCRHPPATREPICRDFTGPCWPPWPGLVDPAAPAAAGTVNLFPGMVSPADLRHLKEIVADFGLSAMMLPDYSRTLDGGLWTDYQRIPDGGTPVTAIAAAGSAAASIELGRILSRAKETAATHLQQHCGVPAHRLALPMGIRQTDRFMETLAAVSGREIPLHHQRDRGRLLDAPGRRPQDRQHGPGP